MKLSFVLPDGKIFSLDVATDTPMSTVRLVVATEANVPDNHILLMKNDKHLSIDASVNIQDHEISDDDLIQVQIISPHIDDATPHSNTLNSLFTSSPGPSQSSVADNVEMIRQGILNNQYELSILKERNKALYDAVNDPAAFKSIFTAQQKISQQNALEAKHLDLSDPLNPDTQRRIAELIQQKNIDHEMETAMEYYPETFGQVTMLYVACELNHFPIKAFVDSGAQSTLMSLKCARQCNLEHLIDRRWSGLAYGVGTQKIIGRIHQAQLKLNGTAIPSSFIVLEDQLMELMIGLDMLKRHRCCINLAENVLIVGDHTRVPFLPEAELPYSAKLLRASSTTAERISDEQQPLQPILTMDQLSKVDLLTSQNVPRERAISLLMETNWDSDMALVKYMSDQT